MVFEADLYEWIDGICRISGYDSLSYDTQTAQTGETIIPALIIQGEYEFRLDENNGTPEICCQIGWDTMNEDLIEACHRVVIPLEPDS